MSVETYRCHLSIPRVMWKELQGEAVARKVAVSRVIVERLEKKGGGERVRPMSGRVSDGAQDNRKWRVAVWLDSTLFDQLSREAAGLGMTRAAVARQWLRRAATTISEKGEGGALNTITAPDELDTVSVPEGRSVMFDF